MRSFPRMVLLKIKAFARGRLIGALEDLTPPQFLDRSDGRFGVDLKESPWIAFKVEAAC